MHAPLHSARAPGLLAANRLQAHALFEHRSRAEASTARSLRRRARAQAEQAERRWRGELSGLRAQLADRDALQVSHGLQLQPPFTFSRRFNTDAGESSQ